MGNDHPLETGPRGGRFYTTATGLKVYVGNGVSPPGAPPAARPVATVPPAARPVSKPSYALPGGLGLKRSEMPQIKSDDMGHFLGYLRDHGINVTQGTAKVRDLKPTQSELNPDKVAGLPADKLRKPVIVSSDGHILDGHNRWARLHGENPDNELATIKVDRPIHDLIKIANGYPRVQHQAVEETGPTQVKAAGDRAERGEFKVQDKPAVDALPNGGRKWVDSIPGLDRETWEMHFDKHPDEGGSPKPERMAAVDKPVIDRILNVPSVGEDKKPIAVLMMGATASGKSSTRKKLDTSAFAVIDSDEIKGDIPEYQRAVAGSAKNAAAMVHEESSWIAKKARDLAIQQRKNILFDGTGKKLESYLSMIDKLKAAGYHVHVIAAHCPMEEGLERAKDRAEKTGRWVPEKEIRASYDAVPHNVGKIFKVADSFSLWDTGGKIGPDWKPRRVWNNDGSRETVEDQDFMDRFHREND